MPRKSPVHYIAPSAVSIVPNANNTASDLAVYVARGTKIKVYSPGIKELGMVNETYQEWTLTGRNRRLADATKPYTIYARLSKTNKTDGYLVFAPMKNRNAGMEGEQPDWHDKYNYPTVEGMTDIDGALTDQNYWYIKLGEVGEPKDGQRTVDLDTGILTTDQYNMEWSTNPADMPLRVEIGCTIGDEDAGPTPYVPAGSQLVLTASLMRGWVDAAEEESFDHWEISRNTGDADADAAWPDTVRKDAFAESGSITITHVRGDGDDFRGLVAVPFTVTAMRRKVEPEPEPEPEPEENPEVSEVADNTEETENAGESEGQEGGEEPVVYEPNASTSITIYAESAETYEIVLSDRKVVYNSSSGTYTPEDGVTIRVRTTDLHGDASDITYGQLETACLSLEYAVGSSGIWTDMDLGGPTEETVITVIPIEVFSSWRDDVYVRLVRDAETSSQGSMSVAIELARQTIAFEEVQQQQEGTREREWIFLRSRSSITFGGASSANPEPFLAPRGQVNPEGIADGSETDKNQDHWVPNGWQMSDPGTDSTWYYVYASYRDWIPASTDPETGEPIAAHWGDFIPARTWHQYNSGGGGEGQYISKIMDDVANGVITFLKGIKIGAKRLFGWDEDGNITANKLFLSLEARINEIRSHNNKGSGIFESGWFVTNNHNGHSYLEIDELLVRMKAVFMELEIRKETYSGGNVFYSPAGSIIYRVECYNAQNERLDAETVEVIRPFTAGGRFLALLSEKTGLFSHRETITRQLEVDHSEVAYYRCYLIADDGTVQTRNWWHVGDQARCQTFNRASEKRETTTTDQEDPDFDENTYVQRNMDGNRFFWRLVHRTGSKKLEDGKWYDYVDLANTNAGISYVQGSDVPMAGDAIVCIGNRSDAERMNMIMLEVIGGDAPAIKIYKGINSFSLDGRKYMSVSPKKIQIRAGSIEYISDNGMELPPKLFRGAWKRNYRYHYYDEVSCDGSTWLCVIIDGYHWETEGGEVVDEPAAGAKRPGEGLFSYGTDQQGNTLTDRYYSSAEVDGVTIYEVRNYTTTKPSDDNALWQKEVSAGGAGTRGPFKSRVFARTNTDIASEQYRPTGGDYDNPWPGGVSGATQHGVTWYDGIPNTDSKYQLWSSVCTFYDDGTSSEWSIPSPESDSQTQDIEFSLSESPSPPSGDTPYSDHSSEGWYDPSRNPTLPDHKTWSDMVWRAERKVRNGVYSGDWVLTRVHGESGDPAPEYMEVQEAWSSVTEVASQTTEPVPNGGWSSSTPANPNNYAYLWRRSRTRVWNAATGTYSTPAWNYVRLSGTNGTSIETKGTVENTNYLLDGYARPYINGATVPESQKVAVSDGWAYVNMDDGHLYQWSDELREKSGSWSGWRSGWIDLGRFQGESGETYFTHIAWGKGVTIGTPTYTPTQGQRTTPNASACQNFSIAPVDGYDYMGTLIDQVSDDCTNWQNYTWKYMNGTNAVRIDLDNEMDAVSVDSTGKVRFARTVTVVACIYDGAVKATGIGHTMQPSSMAIGTRQPTITGPTNDEVTVSWAFQKGDPVTAQPKTIALTYKGHTYTHEFSLTTTEFSAIYQCNPNPPAVSLEWDSQNSRYIPRGVVVNYGYTKDEGNGPVSVPAPSSNSIDGRYYIARRTYDNGAWSSWAFPFNQSTSTVSDTINNDDSYTAISIETCITSSSRPEDITDATIIDREVIPIVRSGRVEIDPSAIPPELIAEIVDEAAKALKDGVSIMINPQNIIVKQTGVGQVNFTNASAGVDVYRSDVKVDFYLSDAVAYGKTDQGAFVPMNDPDAGTYASVTGGTSADTDTKYVSLAGIYVTYNQEKREYEYSYDNGYIYFKVNVPVEDQQTHQTTTTYYWMKVAWYLNRLGNRIVKTMGDIETTYMTRREYSLNDSTTNLLRGTKNPTIGSGGESTDTWNDEGDSNLTIVNLSDDDTPVQGYNEAFKVATTSHSFYQLGTFWSNIATYRFSAYVKAIGSNQTAKIYMSQPVQGGGGFERTFNVGTTWQLVTFDVKVSNYSSTIGTAIFYLGMTSNGAIEYIAPTLIDITDTSVVKTDYEGKIETSANGLSTEFSERCDTIEGNVRTNAHNISTLDQTAREIKAEVSRIEENTEIIMPASTWKSITITDYDIDEYWGVTTKDYVVIPGNLALAMTTTEDWVVEFLYYNSDKVAVGSSGYIEADQTTPYHDGQKYKPASVPSSAVYVKIIAFYPGWESDYGDTDVTHFINVSKPVLVDSKLASTGYVDVTADSVRIGITDDLSSTGIDITENTIHMSAQNTIIDSDVRVGSLSTLGEGCRVNIEGGVTEFFGMNGVCNIRLGLDDDGCAVLKFYNKDGVFMYDLGPNGIVHQLDSKDSTFVATAAIRHAVDGNQNEILLKYNQHANVTSLAQLTSGSTFYRFVEGYSSLTDNIRKYYISQDTVPSSYNDKTYNSQSHSSEQTTWHPTGTLIAAGYYVGNAINISGILYSRDVFEVYSSGDIPSYMGVLYYNYNVSEAKAYLCDASGDNFGESTKYKIIDYLNGNDPSIGPRPRI